MNWVSEYVRNQIILSRNIRNKRKAITDLKEITIINIVIRQICKNLLSDYNVEEKLIQKSWLWMMLFLNIVLYV
jgi:hypothetical protein